MTVAVFSQFSGILDSETLQTSQPVVQPPAVGGSVVPVGGTAAMTRLMAAKKGKHTLFTPASMVPGILLDCGIAALEKVPGIID